MANVIDKKASRYLFIPETIRLFSEKSFLRPNVLMVSSALCRHYGQYVMSYSWFTRSKKFLRWNTWRMPPLKVAVCRETWMTPSSLWCDPAFSCEGVILKIFPWNLWAYSQALVWNCLLPTTTILATSIQEKYRIDAKDLYDNPELFEAGFLFGTLFWAKSYRAIRSVYSKLVREEDITIFF